MTALTAARNTKERIGETFDFPIKAATTCHQGGIAVVDAGYAAPGRSATGLIAAGVFTESATAIAAGDAFKVIAEAIKAGNTTSESIANYLHKELKDYPGLTGNISFNAKGDRVGDLYRLYVVDKDGKFVIQP